MCSLSSVCLQMNRPQKERTSSIVPVCSCHIEDDVTACRCDDRLQKNAYVEELPAAVEHWEKYLVPELSRAESSRTLAHGENAALARILFLSQPSQILVWPVKKLIFPPEKQEHIISRICFPFNRQNQYVWLIFLFGSIWMPDYKLHLYTGFHNVILLCTVTHDGKGVVFSQITHNRRLGEMASFCVVYTVTFILRRSRSSWPQSQNGSFLLWQEICKLQVRWLCWRINSICHISVTFNPPPLSHTAEINANNLQMKSDTAQRSIWQHRGTPHVSRK